MKKFEELKSEYDLIHSKDTEVDCFLPVHLTTCKKETHLFKKDGTHNEQYYKWQLAAIHLPNL